MKSVQCSLIVATALLVASSAFGEVLFQDNFDTDTVGQNPVAEVGNWTFLNGPNVLVTDAASPGPSSSPNYLNVTRDAADGGAYANFGLQSEPTDLIRMELDWYAGAYNAQIQVLDPSDNLRQYLSLTYLGEVKGSDAETIATVSTGAWHNLAIEYSPSASTCDVFVDDVLEGDDEAIYAAGSFSKLLLYTTSAPGVTYYDNVEVSKVPEPASVALLVSALLGLMAYAWRKRK